MSVSIAAGLSVTQEKLSIRYERNEAFFSTSSYSSLPSYTEYKLEDLLDLSDKAKRDLDGLRTAKPGLARSGEKVSAAQDAFDRQHIQELKKRAGILQSMFGAASEGGFKALSGHLNEIIGHVKSLVSRLGDDPSFVLGNERVFKVSETAFQFDYAKTKLNIRT